MLHCMKCGTQLSEGLRYCPTCGNLVSVDNPPPEAPIVVVTTGMKVWGIFCIVANAIVLLINFAFIKEDPMFGVLGMLGLVSITAHSLILNAKKAGFYILCAEAVVVTLVNFYFGVGTGFLGMLGAAAHLAITWAIINKSWKYFDAA